MKAGGRPSVPALVCLDTRGARLDASPPIGGRYSVIGRRSSVVGGRSNLLRSLPRRSRARHRGEGGRWSVSRTGRHRCCHPSGAPAVELGLVCSSFDLEPSAEGRKCDDDHQLSGLGRVEGCHGTGAPHVRGHRPTPSERAIRNGQPDATGGSVRSVEYRRGPRLQAPKAISLSRSRRTRAGRRTRDVHRTRLPIGLLE